MTEPLESGTETSTQSEEAAGSESAVEIMAGDTGSGGMIQQGDAQVSSEQPVPRGIPHPDRYRLRAGWREGGEARIRALTDMFGADALILGHLLFKIPALAIRIRKGEITYRWKPLRTNESIAVKSGNGECYIEIDLAFEGLDQLNNSLAHLVALWKKVPFCFIENAHIRKMMIPDRPEDSMMVCLDTLVADAVAGTPQTVWATLILRWFNYKVCSQNAWYRRQWESTIDPPGGDPATAIIERVSDDALTEMIETGNAATTQANLGRVIPRSDADTTIVDLSAMNEPETMALAMPPEVRLEHPSDQKDPSDPYIRPTYPVTYPWNSVPFMRRVVEGRDPPKVLDGWADGVVFNWRSFTRVPMPRSLAYRHRQQAVEITREGRVRTGERRPTTSGSPGDRNIVLFVGNSISVGFLGISGLSNTGVGSHEIPLHSFTPPSSLQRDGFEFYSLAKVGAHIRTMARRLEEVIGNNEFRTPGGQAGDRIAMIVYMGGINDHPRSSNYSAVQAAYDDIKGQANRVGAIAVPMTPWPIVGIRDDYINTEEESYLKQLCQYIMEHWAPGDDDQISAINLHDTSTSQGVGALSTEPSGFNGEMPDGVHTDASFTGGYDPHPTQTGNQRLAAHIGQQLPWDAAIARTGQGAWDICYVEDGDTVFASRGSELQIVRFNYCDTLETYGHHDNPANDAILPQGQDTGRPAEQQWGRLARNRTAELCGCDLTTYSGGSAEIEFFGEDAYGRQLGVLTAGGVNINLKLLEEGLAVTNPEFNEPNQYTQKFNEARDARRGLHRWVTTSSTEQTRNYTPPYTWRKTYPPREDEDGGAHEFTVEDPPPACD